jgi:glycosyltransferase involved in cell wall biosynthesis
MRIAIYHHGIEFDGSTPFTQPLGGSESSVVYMARELARHGHEVTVYANIPKKNARPVSEDDLSLTYLHYHRFCDDYVSSPWDVLISFRSFDPFLLGCVAPRMIFWCGDSYDQPVLEHFAQPMLQENIDLIFCVSEWHRRTFIEHFKLPPQKVVATRNGFYRELISTSANREWTRCAYSSTPFRGLDVLLRMFPGIRAQLPDLTLDVFSSMKVYGWTNEADQQEFGPTYAAASQPGVTWHGGVPQPVLMKHLSATGLLLYPNTFDETDLREFVSVVTGLIKTPSRLAALSAAAQQRAFRLYDWGVIAAEWTDIFRQMPPRLVHQRWSGPLSLLQKTHEYLQNGNVSAAGRVLAVLERTPFLRNEVEVVKGKLSTWM